MRGFSGVGILLTGESSVVDRVTVENNSGGGMCVCGTVTQSNATRNGAFGILASNVRDSTATHNRGDGIIIDAGLAQGNIAAFNEDRGIALLRGAALDNITIANRRAGISAFRRSRKTSRPSSKALV